MMTNCPRKQEIYAGTRGLILGAVKRKRWSIAALAKKANVPDDLLRLFLTARYGEISVDRDVLDRLLKFGKSRLRPWSPQIMRMLRMSRDFEALYR